MDLVFKCTHCDQELAVDAAGGGSEIECPSCGQTLTVPEANPQNLQTLNPISSSAAAKESKHFAVPVRDTPAEALIKKPRPSLEIAAKESDKKIRIKTIRHGDCVEVGRDRFDEIASEFLEKIGQTNIVSINPITYSHIDLATRQAMADFGVMIVFKG
ncbi:MAG: hypothetical protein M3Y82_07025 [Verrucomicrobiota bacterium]|nr:hypothetical protein [Verrucomicrobiota bacterium]